MQAENYYGHEILSELPVQRSYPKSHNNVTYLPDEANHMYLPLIQHMVSHH